MHTLQPRTKRSFSARGNECVAFNLRILSPSNQRWVGSPLCVEGSRMPPPLSVQYTCAHITRDTWLLAWKEILFAIIRQMQFSLMIVLDSECERFNVVRARVCVCACSCVGRRASRWRACVPLPAPTASKCGRREGRYMPQISFTIVTAGQSSADAQRIHRDGAHHSRLFRAHPLRLRTTKSSFRQGTST